MSDEILQLGDQALAEFDEEYVKPRHWKHLRGLIDRDFGDRPFRFLDIGGGNGKYTDQLLDFYPNAEATLLDNAQLLLDRNTPNPRKRLICDSVENLQQVCRGERFDLISFNWVLHHLIVPGYQSTRQTQTGALRQASSLLSDRGRVSVFENIYTGSLLTNLPAWLVFGLTSKKTIAPITRMLGANTAGVGVCFGSKPTWDRIFDTAGLAIENYHPDDEWPVSHFRRIFLHIGSIRFGHYWLANRAALERQAAA